MLSRYVLLVSILVISALGQSTVEPASDTDAPFVELIFPTVAPTTENETDSDSNSTDIPETLRCQFANGTLWGLATACSDEYINCASTFNETVEGYARPVRCYDENYAVQALRCAKTCAICCETPGYACEDDSRAPIDCAGNRRFCRNQHWSLVMMTYCQKTCGYCG
uniref:ShKT domain-containing protein n=1 Tax=Panagrellus redivivus TaxID=6233 RepID=A0A7E4W153_PANRE